MMHRLGRTLSFYPPGMTTTGFPQTCVNNHVWTTAMWNELGGSFYVDEANGPYCPVCQSESLDNPKLAEERLAAVKSVTQVGPDDPDLHVRNRYDWAD